MSDRCPVSWCAQPMPHAHSTSTASAKPSAPSFASLLNDPTQQLDESGEVLSVLAYQAALPAAASALPGYASRYGPVFAHETDRDQYDADEAVRRYASEDEWWDRRLGIPALIAEVRALRATVAAQDREVERLRGIVERVEALVPFRDVDTTPFAYGWVSAADLRNALSPGETT